MDPTWKQGALGAAGQARKAWMGWRAGPQLRRTGAGHIVAAVRLQLVMNE